LKAAAPVGMFWVGTAGRERGGWWKGEPEAEAEAREGCEERQRASHNYGMLNLMSKEAELGIVRGF